MFDDLLDPDYGVDNSPPDDTNIFQFILFYSEEEMNEMKQLCKTGIKKEFPDNPTENGNASDLILKLLRRLYGQTNIKEQDEASAGRVISGHVLDGQ